MAKPAKVIIVGDASNAKRALKELEDSAGKMKQKLHLGLGAVKAGAIGAVAGLAALGVGMSKAVGLAGKQEQAVSQLNAVIKSTGGVAGITAEHVQDLASSLQKTTTYGDETTIAGANLLLTFKNLRNEAGAGNDIFDRTTSIMLDMSTAMGQDMKSSAIQLGKALNDPITGLSALSRVGITFTDQQKDQIKTLQASGDLLGAQKILLKELESQFKGSAQAAADAGTGPFLQFQNIVGDIGEKIGGIVLPALQHLAQWATGQGQKVIDWFDSVAGKEWVGNLQDGLENVIGKVPEYFEKATTWVKNLWQATEGLRQQFGNMISGLGSVLTWAYDFATAMGGLPLKVAAVAGALALLYANPVLAGIGALGLLIGNITQSSREAKHSVEELGDAIVEQGQGAIHQWAQEQALAIFANEKWRKALEHYGVSIQDVTAYIESGRAGQDSFRSAVGLTGVQVGINAGRFSDAAAHIEDYAGVVDGATEAAHNQLEAQTDLRQATGQTGESFDRAGGAAKRWKGNQEEATSAVDDTTEAIDANIAALSEQADAMRSQTDPVFHLIDAQENYTEAQKNTTDALNKYGEGSPEWIDAIGKQAGAFSDLQDAALSLKGSGVDPLSPSFEHLLETMGFTKAEAGAVQDAFSESFRQVREDFDKLPSQWDLHIGLPRFKYDQQSGEFVPSKTREVVLAEGGIATGPTPAWVGEGGSDEAIIPLNARGISILAEVFKQAMGGGSAGPALQLSFGNVYGFDDFEDKVAEALVKAKRRGVAV